MSYGYYDYYTTPIVNYVNSYMIMTVAVVIAIVLGIVLFFTFLKKNNEGKFTGVKGKIYNALVFNRFYAENVIKFLYIVAACVVTVLGIVQIVLGSFVAGIITLTVGNILLRIGTELVLMFIIMCRKTVSMDRRLSRIEAFYEDQYGDDWECDGDLACDGYCDDCDEADECAAAAAEADGTSNECAECSAEDCVGCEKQEK